MIGNRVRVYRLHGADEFDGVLLKQDATGIVVQKRDGFNDERLFIPLTSIGHIRDLGRAP